MGIAGTLLDEFGKDDHLVETGNSCTVQGTYKIGSFRKSGGTSAQLDLEQSQRTFTHVRERRVVAIHGCDFRENQRRLR